MTTTNAPKPRRRLWLVLGLGLLLCLALVVIIGVLPGGDQPATPPPASAPTAAAQTAPDEPPTATPAPDIAQIGDRVEAGGIAVTIASASTVDSFDLMNAADGKTYLVVDALIENVSLDTAPYNPLYFSLKDGDAYQYDSAILAPDPSLKSGDLPRGDRVRGNVAFEIPRNAAGLVLTYEPLVIAGGFQPIRVAVDP